MTEKNTVDADAADEGVVATPEGPSFNRAMAPYWAVLVVGLFVMMGGLALDWWPLTFVAIASMMVAVLRMQVVVGQFEDDPVTGTPRRVR